MALVSCKSQNKFPSVTAAEAAVEIVLFLSKHPTVKWIVSWCAVSRALGSLALPGKGKT